MDQEKSEKQSHNQSEQQSEQIAPPVEIPKEALNAETLKALIESFILREGTDYGWNEVELETKMNQIQAQMKNGKVKIVFDPNSESVTLMTEREWNQLQKPSTR